MNIIVEIKNVYGNETIYPLCDKATAFANIAGTKTLTRHVIAQIKAIGFSITIKPQTL